MKPPTPATLHHYFSTLGARGGAKATPAQQRARSSVFVKRWPAKPPHGLTAAQHEVLTLRAVGRTFAQIAKTRGTAQSTVLNHSTAGCRKLGLTGTTDVEKLRKALALSDPAFS